MFLRALNHRVRNVEYLYGSQFIFSHTFEIRLLKKLEKHHGNLKRILCSSDDCDNSTNHDCQ